VVEFISTFNLGKEILRKLRTLQNVHRLDYPDDAVVEEDETNLN